MRDAFAEALGLVEDEVELDALLIEDLGAESLDFKASASDGRGRRRVKSTGRSKRRG